MNTRNIFIFILSVIYAVLWFGGVMSYTVLEADPSIQPITAPMFLWCAALLSIIGFSSRGHVLWLLLASGAAFVAEIIGVATGTIFGSYQYGNGFGMQLFNVPLAIMAAWLILLAYVWHITSWFHFSIFVKALIAAAWMVAIDIIIDPVSAGPIGFWEWKAGGSFYGIPLSNFLGWFAVSLPLFLFLQRERFTQTSSHLVGFSIVLFFTILAAASFPALALFGMFLLALDMILLRPEWLGYGRVVKDTLKNISQKYLRGIKRL